MLSALSVAEFCLKEAARLAAIRRRRASCRWRSWRSRERSRITPPRPLGGLFGRGGGHFFSCERGRREEPGLTGVTGVLHATATCWSLEYHETLFFLSSLHLQTDTDSLSEREKRRMSAGDTSRGTRFISHCHPPSCPDSPPVATHCS